MMLVLPWLRLGPTMRMLNVVDLVLYNSVLDLSQLKSQQLQGLSELGLPTVLDLSQLKAQQWLG